MKTEDIQILPIFGYGNFGSNCTVIGTSEKSFIFDLGMTFDDQGHKYYEKLNRSFKKRDLSPTFILLTHAHADHVSFILDGNFKKLDLPIYCSDFSRRFIEKRTKKLNLIVLTPLEIIEIETFRIKPILIEHSCQGTFAFQVTTPTGTLITIIPDHKLETASIIDNFQIRPNILFLESTNSIEKERIDSEDVVLKRLENEYDLRSKSANNIFITTFSLCTRRIMKIIELAKIDNKKVLIVGKSIQYTLRILLDTQRVDYDKLVFLKRAVSVLDHIRQENNLIVICSGHQGQTNAALPKLLEAEAISSNDLILFLSKQIPDPEAIIKRTELLSNILKAKVPFVDNIHCSGHAAIPELTYTLKKINSELVIPMHGDAKNLGGLVDLINKNKIPSRVRILVNGQYITLKTTINESRSLPTSESLVEI